MCVCSVYPVLGLWMSCLPVMSACPGLCTTGLYCAHPNRLLCPIMCQVRQAHPLSLAQGQAATGQCPSPVPDFTYSDRTAAQFAFVVREVHLIVVEVEMVHCNMAGRIRMISRKREDTRTNYTICFINLF